ncbi:hypothetical protein OPQ81_002761 [Rhizoctonia solani]|nr:hypothetical protein OPQ81_002761 [Rhizoctonia solani]
MIFRSFIIFSRRTLSIATRLPSARLRPTTRFLFPLASPFATTSSGPTIQQKLDMSAKDIAETAIANKDKKKIAIFSKSYCPYCQRAKAQIDQFVKSLSADQKDQLEVQILELDERNDGAAIQDYLATKTKQRTVPNIFISEQHIGGSSDLAGYDNDNIKKILFSSPAV